MTLTVALLSPATTTSAARMHEPGSPAGQFRALTYNVAGLPAGLCLSQKGFSVARTTVAPGVEIDLYNLHGEAGNTPLDQQHRATDFEQLAEFIAGQSAGRPVIVGGDFNLNTDRSIDRDVFDTFLAATGLTDVCTVVDCGDDRDRIDKFVYRSGGGVTVQALTHRFERETFRRADGAPLSDHDPLAVTFAWTGSTGGGPPAVTPPDEAGDAPGRPRGGGPGVAQPARPVAAIPRFTG
jgi:hypothetical protein